MQIFFVTRNYGKPIFQQINNFFQFSDYCDITPIILSQSERIEMPQQLSDVVELISDELQVSSTNRLFGIMKEKGYTKRSILTCEKASGKFDILT